MIQSEKPRTVVLIDDDDLIHVTWRIYCRVRGVDLLSFSSVETAVGSPAVRSLTRDLATWIVVDSDLGQGVARGEVSSRVFNELGFARIWIATGHLPQEIQVSEWVTGIRGKEPWF